MTDMQDDFDRIYEMGYKHGYAIGKLDVRLEQLKKEIGEL